MNGIVQCGKNGIPSGCMASHVLNPAPRIGFAWSPFGNRTAIRGGYGVFFEHGTADEANTGSLEGGAPLVLDIDVYKRQVPRAFMAKPRASQGRCLILKARLCRKLLSR